MNNENLKLERAKERIKDVKDFYRHLAVYVIVNLFLVILIVFGRMQSGDSFLEAFFNFATFATALFWGIGLLFHALSIFSTNLFFSKDWEERQIRKYMDNEDKVI